jgi:drug/metabolite transporter (DMT)-like permease
MRRDVLAALAQTSASAALWGTSFPVISVALKGGLSPGAFVFLRFALAAPVMLLAVLALGRDPWRLFKDRMVWAVAFFDAVGFLCQFIGQQYTSASVAALLVNLSVVLAAIGGAVFLGERLGAYKVAGVVLAFGGTALIATGGSLSGLAEGELLGDALYVAAALAWAGYIVCAKRGTDNRGWDPVACIVSLTAVFVLPAALAAGTWEQMSIASWEAIGYTAVFNTAIPFVLYQLGLKRLSAGSSAIVLMLEIVVAVAISVALLGESFTPLAALGAAAILASILLVSGVEARGKSLSVAVSGAGGAQGSV